MTVAVAVQLLKRVVVRCGIEVEVEVGVEVDEADDIVDEGVTTVPTTQ